MEKCYCFYLFRPNCLTARLLRLIYNTYLYQIDSIFGLDTSRACKSKFEVQVATAKYNSGLFFLTLSAEQFDSMVFSVFSEIFILNM